MTVLRLFPVAISVFLVGAACETEAEDSPLTMPEQSSDASSETLSDEECFAAWRTPVVSVTAGPRATSPLPGSRISFSYGVDAAGMAFIVLDEIRPDGVVRPSVGPFSVEEYSGGWVELRDSSDQILYTQGGQLVADNKEAPGNDGGFSNHRFCPQEGFKSFWGFPDDPAATHIVVLQPPVGSQGAGPTMEIARFELP